MFRIGHGYDVHAFDLESTGPIRMGGVDIDYNHCFLAHSDGDVLLHAICDAMLGALSLGDIGKYFPDTSAEFYKIDSRILLRKTYELIKSHGYKLGNIDTTIVAQAPKFAPYIGHMQQVIAHDLNVDINQVSIKATTSERLGFTGRQEGIAVNAVCILIKIA